MLISANGRRLRGPELNYHSVHTEFLAVIQGVMAHRPLFRREKGHCKK